jgi:hypothetical protein
MSPLELHDHHEDDEQIDLFPMTNEQLKNLLESSEGKKYFEGKKKEIQCMDGRLNGGDGMGGSGILYDRDPNNSELPAPELLDKLKKRVERGELTKITWHKDCGAAKIFLQNNGNPNPKKEEIIEAAINFSTKLAEALGLPFEEAEHAGPNHTETGIYIDSTDRFTEISKDGAQLRNGFVLSPELTEKNFNYHIKEVDIAISISFDNPHGPGADKFSPDNKYFIMLINDPNKPGYFGNFKSMIEELIERKYKKYSDRIEIMEVNPQI